MRHLLFLMVLGFSLDVAVASAATSTISVNIESSPPGAAVFVDSAESNALGMTPMTKVRVTRGNHVLIFRLEGYEELRLPVNIRRWGETFRATLKPNAAIVVNAGGETAQGASVRLNGEEIGVVPTKTVVKPGRHLIQVGKTGYKTFSQWVELVGGQVLTLPVVLEAEAEAVGKLLVTADVTGVPVFVDGQPRGGTPVVIDRLSVGEHVVELKSDDPTIANRSQVVTIVANSQTALDLKLKSPDSTGSLRVITNAPGAIVSVQGKDIGIAPALKDGLPPGEYLVSARAQGYSPSEQTVTVAAGKERVVSLRLDGGSTAQGRIVVSANVDNATVWVDGEKRGKAPIVINDPAPGAHSIVIKADGFREVRRSCEVGVGKDCRIEAELGVVGTPLRVESNARKSELYIDDELMGPVPWEGDVPSGSHRLEVRAPGYEPYLEQIALRPSQQTKLVEAALVPVGELSVQEREQAADKARREARAAITHAGAVLPKNVAALDLSAGWPYLFEMRMGVGITRYLDAGISVRTFYRLTDFEARVKGGWRPLDQLSIGGQLRVGGGVGPKHLDERTNSALFGIDFLSSLHFADAGAFTLRIGTDVTSDRWAFTGSNSDVLVAGSKRQTLVRARIGGSFDFVLSRKWNMFLLIEGMFKKPRRVVGDFFGGGNDDKRVHGRIGFTYKFGTSRD
ncbi:MAG: PEGA domain-containing protein [Polyangiales bacterium]